jgi:putative flippase GtrA
MVNRHMITELVRFGLVGVLNTLSGLFIIIALMRSAGVDYLLANAVGYACGITLSFFINRSWTFRHKGSMFQSAIQWGKVTAMAYVVNLGVVVLAHEYFGIEPYASQLLGLVAYSLLSYLGGKYYAFHQQAQSSLELAA